MCVCVCVCVCVFSGMYHCKALRAVCKRACAYIFNMMMMIVILYSAVSLILLENSALWQLFVIIIAFVMLHLSLREIQATLPG